MKKKSITLNILTLLFRQPGSEEGSTDEDKRNIILTSKGDPEIIDMKITEDGPLNYKNFAIEDYLAYYKDKEDSPMQFRSIVETSKLSN